MVPIPVKNVAMASSRSTASSLRTSSISSSTASEECGFDGGASSGTSASTIVRRRRGFEAGERVLCFEPDPTKVRVVYDAKILRVSDKAEETTATSSLSLEPCEFLVHFQGWNSSWDRYVPESHLLKDTPETRKLQRDLFEKAQQITQRKSGASPSCALGPSGAAASVAASAAASGRRKRERPEPQAADEASLASSGRHRAVPTARANHPGVLGSVQWSEGLRQILDLDHEVVVRRCKLARLPARPCVAEALEEHIRFYGAARLAQSEKQRRRAAVRKRQHSLLGSSSSSYNTYGITNASTTTTGCSSVRREEQLREAQRELENVTEEINLAKEVAEGLRILFDSYLPTLLLYDEEEEQYNYQMKRRRLQQEHDHGQRRSNDVVTVPPAHGLHQVVASTKSEHDREEKLGGFSKPSDDLENPDGPEIGDKNVVENTDDLGKTVGPPLPPSDDDDLPGSKEGPSRPLIGSDRVFCRPTGDPLAVVNYCCLSSRCSTNSSSAKSVSTTLLEPLAVAMSTSASVTDTTVASERAASLTLRTSSAGGTQQQDALLSRPMQRNRPSPLLTMNDSGSQGLHRKVHSLLDDWKLVPEWASDQEQAGVLAPMPSLVYGPIHLLRLLIKLPDILNEMGVPPKIFKVLMRQAELVADFLLAMRSDYFNESNTYSQTGE